MFTLEEIAKVTGGKVLSNKKKTRFKHISTDSRKIKKNDLFIPLKGPNFDGRKFIKQALKKGATVLDTKNGLKALQHLAAYHRQKFNIPIIGITGSSGKTTTREMLASIIKQELKVLKNEENYNNEIGVPLTLLHLNKSHQVAVIEMAMQNLGEIDLLAKIVKPTIVIITNIGEAHLKYLKTTKNVAKAKAEVFNYLSSGNTAILPADDKYIKFLKQKVPKGVKIKTFGITKINKNQEFIEQLSVPGRHHIYDALAAIKAAKLLKIKAQSIKQGLKKFKPASKRTEFIKRKDNVVIINDTYNANPQSMRAALLVLASQSAKRRIAVLGDMRELGKIEKPAHIEIGNLARKLGIDILITVGQLAKLMKGHKHFSSNKQIITYLKKLLKPGDIMLCKASRGMKLEQVVAAVK